MLQKIYINILLVLLNISFLSFSTEETSTAITDRKTPNSTKTPSNLIILASSSSPESRRRKAKNKCPFLPRERWLPADPYTLEIYYSRKSNLANQTIW